MGLSSLTYWTYQRRFAIDGVAFVVETRARIGGMDSVLLADGLPIARDATPATGREAARNHRLATTLPDGRRVEVEAGYAGWWTIGIIARIDGRIVHASHPGRDIAYPAAAARIAADPGYDLSAYKRNQIPLMIDMALGLLFFVVAKLTDLSTAALVGAGAGIALLIIQRFVKTDIVGGMAMFGVVMLIVSAGLAIAFQDDMAVKLRSTIIGVITAVSFMIDGAFKGRWLGHGLMRYLPYRDIRPARLAVGMGVLGLVMAGLNLLVAEYASTNVWLFYSTFVDFALVMAMAVLVFRFARGKPLFGTGRR